MAAEQHPVLEVVDAHKSFGAVRALHGASFCLRQAEILALLGDNGAGKSTVIKALSGVHQLDQGEIRMEGHRIELRSPADARRHGIETVYQDLALFDNLSPVANFFAGRELRRLGRLGGAALLNERAMLAEWETLRERLGVNIRDSNQPLGMMSGGQRQACAVARAVSFARKVVILDEPTAALGVRESGNVLRLIKRLPDEGLSVILISHNLDDVVRVADRATILRHGYVVGEEKPGRDTYEKMVSLIVGSAPLTAAVPGVAPKP
jgi:ABC-type sugar transport system ATPase subunit